MGMIGAAAGQEGKHRRPGVSGEHISSPSARLTSVPGGASTTLSNSSMQASTRLLSASRCSARDLKAFRTPCATPWTSPLAWRGKPMPWRGMVQGSARPAARLRGRAVVVVTVWPCPARALCHGGARCRSASTLTL